MVRLDAGTRSVAGMSARVGEQRVAHAKLPVAPITRLSPADADRERARPPQCQPTPDRRPPRTGRALQGPRFFACLALVATRLVAAPGDARLAIPLGGAVTADGLLAPGEWDDAAEVRLDVAAGWHVVVRAKRDAASLHFLFAGLRHGPLAERYAELLLDTHVPPPSRWQPGTWWLHASHSDCEADGEHDVYEKDGASTCAPAREGWTANNFPLGDPALVEMSVRLDKIAVPTGEGASFGLALRVTDTGGSDTIWPEGAALGDPRTWARVTLSAADAARPVRFVAPRVRDGEGEVENEEARNAWYAWDEPSAPRATIAFIPWTEGPGVNVLNGLTEPMRLSVGFGPWVGVEAGATVRVPAPPGVQPVIVVDARGRGVTRSPAPFDAPPRTGIAIAPR